MATVFACLGLSFLALSLHSLRPLRWPGPLVLPAWFASWPVIELAPHWIVLQGATAGFFMASGGLADELGWLGAGATALSMLALSIHVVRARNVGCVIDRALAEGLGVAPAADGRAGERPDWWRLARLVPMRHPGVERERNCPYFQGRGRRFCLDIYRSREVARAGADAPRRPVLLYIHGGGWVIGNKGQQGLLTVNHMAARGWVCFSANYRLSPWATFPDHLIDVKRAIAWVREHAAEYGGDPDFIVLAGGSAGAHLASLAALTPGELEYQRDAPDADTRVAGCVGFYGVYDFCNRHGHWPHRFFRVLLERAIMKVRFDRAREAFERASPITRVGPHAPPFFLLHGDLDNLSPIDESRRFAEALRAVSQQPVVLAELPGAQHAFELLPSVRSLAAVQGVSRFCHELYRRHRAAVSADDARDA